MEYSAVIELTISSTLQFGASFAFQIRHKMFSGVIPLSSLELVVSRIHTNTSY